MRKSVFAGVFLFAISMVLALLAPSSFGAVPQAAHLRANSVTSAYPLFALSPDRGGVFEYNGSGWTQIGGPAAQIYSRAGCLVATNPQSGDVYEYLGTPNSWVRVGGPGWSFAIDDACDLYGLNATGVFQWQGGTNWIQIGGPAAIIRAGSTFVVATNPQNGNVFQYLGTPNSWRQIGGPGADFGIDTAGNVFGLNGTGVFEWTGSGLNWTQVGGPAAHIYVAGGMVATNPQTGNVFAYHYAPNSWTQVGGPGITFSITHDGQLYGLNSGGVFHWVGGLNWTQVGGPAATIAA